MFSLLKRIPSQSLLKCCHICRGVERFGSSQSSHEDGTLNVKKSSLFSVENIFSEDNKCRVQRGLSLVKSPRTKKHVDIRPDHGTAAVLVPLCVVEKQPSLLLTLRSRKLAKYKGQVSFPGGNMDASDPNVVFTALRETQEELGMDPSEFEIWGEMNTMPASLSGTMVHPILARTGEVDVSKIKVNDDEVEEVFAVSIQHLCNIDNIHSTRFRSKHSYTIPVYTGVEHRIWGFTAIIIHMLMSILVPELYPFKLQHQHDKR